MVAATIIRARSKKKSLMDAPNILLGEEGEGGRGDRQDTQGVNGKWCSYGPLLDDKGWRNKNIICVSRLRGEGDRRALVVARVS